MCSLLVFHRALWCCLQLFSVPALVPHLCVFPAAVLRSKSSIDFLISLCNSFPHLFLASLHFSHLHVNFHLLSFSTLYCLYLLCSFVFSSPYLSSRSPKGEALSFFRSFSSPFFELSLILCQYRFCLFYRKHFFFLIKVLSVWLVIVMKSFKSLRHGWVIVMNSYKLPSFELAILVIQFKILRLVVLENYHQFLSLGYNILIN